MNEKDVVFIPETLFQDTSLSWEAYGVLAFIYSMGGQTTVAEIASAGRASTMKLRRTLNELEKAGYIKRIKINDKNGRFRWVVSVSQYAEKVPDDLDPNVVHYIYIAQRQDGLVKIGATRDLRQRDYALNRTHKASIVFAIKFPTSEKDYTYFERQVHEFVAESRVGKGELFSLDQVSVSKTMSFIRQLSDAAWSAIFGEKR